MDLLEGLATTRSIRRYTDEPVTDEQLRTVLWAATRAPSGSNRQPFRFVVLRDGPAANRDARAANRDAPAANRDAPAAATGGAGAPNRGAGAEVRRLLTEAAEQMWSFKRSEDGYDTGSGTRPDSPKARMARTMAHYAAHIGDAPVIVLACLVRYRKPDWMEGASVYPACQNLLLAARAIGLGGVLTQIQTFKQDEIREVLGIPEGVGLHATITLGHPAGGHGPVRRRPMRELVFEGGWDAPAPWASDPEGTRFTRAGPPPGGQK